jgi:Bacterial dnaA protein helix-turn-helix
MRSDVVDYGFREAAARRERLLAASSPAVRARIAGTRAAYESVPTAGRITVDLATGMRTIVKEVQPDLRVEFRELRRQLEALRREVERLREEGQQPVQSSGIAEVVECFVAELADAGYCIDGDPVTLNHLLSDRIAAAWARPRMVAMWLSASIAREASLPKVAGFFRRDHTTVVHARRQIGRVLAKAPALREAALATCMALGAAPPSALKGQS